jgi:hypothetical protein
MGALAAKISVLRHSETALFLPSEIPSALVIKDIASSEQNRQCQKESRFANEEPNERSFNSSAHLVLAGQT